MGSLHRRPPRRAEFARVRSKLLNRVFSGEDEVSGSSECCPSYCPSSTSCFFFPCKASNCASVLRRSQPECQQQATVYGSPGQVWGELTVDVSSPVLFITKPKDLIQKRKNKNKEKEK